MNEQAPRPIPNLDNTPDNMRVHQPPTEHTTAEVPDSGNPDGLSRVRLPAAVLVGASEDVELGGKQDTAEKLRAAHEGWLERRGIDLARVPRLTMGEREHKLFTHAHPDDFSYTREIYGIPQDDQDNSQYALVDKNFDDPSRRPEPELMIVNDKDFGTIIQNNIIAEDFQDGNLSPDDPSRPEKPGNAYITVDISNTLADSRGELATFAKELMEGQTVDPFTSAYEDIGVRAGGLEPGQKNAYIWRDSSMTKSVELTLALPGLYDSVCVVGGRMREAANGKPTMAQIDNPVELLKIEGPALKALQGTYQRLYRRPDFALTERQRSERDELFNDHVASLISQTARENKAKVSETAQENEAQEDYRRRAAEYARKTQLRARERPRN